MLSNKYYYIDYHLKKLCLLCITTIIFSWCCTFYSFPFITISFYIINITLLAVLYRVEIRECVFIGREYIKKLRYKKEEKGKNNEPIN